jgi:hypothetical protein
MVEWFKRRQREEGREKVEGRKEKDVLAMMFS